MRGARARFGITLRGSRPAEARTRNNFPLSAKRRPDPSSLSSSLFISDDAPHRGERPTIARTSPRDRRRRLSRRRRAPDASSF